MKVEKNSAVRPRGTDSAKLMVVIVTESLKGCGTMTGVCLCATWVGC